MKIKHAIQIAERKYLTHVAVNKDRFIIAYYLADGYLQPAKTRWEIITPSLHDTKIELGFYTGKKNWKKTLRLTEMGKLANRRMDE